MSYLQLLCTVMEQILLQQLHEKERTNFQVMGSGKIFIHLLSSSIMSTRVVVVIPGFALVPGGISNDTQKYSLFSTMMSSVIGMSKQTLEGPEDGGNSTT